MESGGGRDPSRPVSEEAAKENTDCVYFLASPLTCKKGNECEYRHSEGARVNPRDCWFWLNGNCLNPNCSFRHPPLDGFLGAPVTTHPGPTLPSTQTAMPSLASHGPATHTMPSLASHAPATHTMPSLASHAPATHSSSKQSIPCYYFQKGGCLKGEWCPFMHDVPAGNNPNMQQTAKADTPVTEPTSALKSTFCVLENYVQHNVPKVTADKRVEASQSSTKVDVKAETELTSGLSIKSSLMSSPLSYVTSHILPPAIVTCNASDVSVRPENNCSEPLNEHVQNGREADESLRESSPGFDVLVDGECEDTNYFHVDGRDTSSHDVDKLNVANDIDYHHSSVYNSMAQFEREPHRTRNEVSEYDKRGRRDRYRQDDRRYSERIKDRISIQEKGTSHREDCRNEIDGSDLRYRLLKKRKVNGLRSAISTDHHGEPYRKNDQYADKQRYHSRNSGRDQHHFTHESSISKRLQGRITLPEKPPSDNPINLHSKKESERGKDWARSSSSVQPLSYQGRLHDRIMPSMHEAGNLEGQPRRDEMDPLKFSGPKSLAEIKGTKFSTDTKDRLSKVNKATISQEPKGLRLKKALGPSESECSLSFEGPKPLSEILKRKRQAAPANDAMSSNGYENNQKVVEDHVGGSMVTPITDSQDVCLSDPQNRVCPPPSKTEGPKSTAVEEQGPRMTDGEELPQTDQSSAKKGMLGGEEDSLADNAEDPEIGAYDPREGKFEYEIEEGTDFRAEDNEELTCPDQSSQKEEVFEPEDGMLVDNMEDSEENYDQRDGEVEYDEVEGTDFSMYDENDQKDEDNADEDDDDDDFARKIGVMFS